MLRHYPDNFEGIVFKGVCLAALGFPAEAKQCFEKGIELDPSAQRYAIVGETLYKMGHTSACLPYLCTTLCTLMTLGYLDEALKKNPDIQSAAACKALALSSMGKRKEAIDFLNQKGNSTAVLLLVKAGILKLMEGDHTEEITGIYEDIIKAHPSDASVLPVANDLAQIYLDKGDLNGAEDLLYHRYSAIAKYASPRVQVHLFEVNNTRTERVISTCLV
jgi:tetratricopeptide (TPR) repeat protein